MEVQNLDTVYGGLEFNVYITVPFQIKDKFYILKRKLKQEEFIKGEVFFLFFDTFSFK
jgi:hypothetical protein